jgi:hypothetical protein
MQGLRMMRAHSSKSSAFEDAPVDVSKRQRLVGVAIDAGALLAFGCVLIGAGHGVGPITLLMFVDSPEVWSLPVAVGWAGVALLLIAVLVPRRALYVPMALGGLAALLASWRLFLYYGEAGIALLLIAHRDEPASLGSSLVLSIPFLGVLAGRLVYLMVQLRGRGASA